MLRTLNPHCQANAPIIDVFYCSECEWSYVMRQPKPYIIPFGEAERACREFDGHQCDDFKPREQEGVA